MRRRETQLATTDAEIAEYKIGTNIVALLDIHENAGSFRAFPDAESTTEINEQSQRESPRVADAR